MVAETVTVDRCWTTQDGVVMALCVTAKKLPATVALPRELPAGTAILAERQYEGWRLVDPRHHATGWGGPGATVPKSGVGWSSEP